MQCQRTWLIKQVAVVQTHYCLKTSCTLLAWFTDCQSQIPEWLFSPSVVRHCHDQKQNTIAKALYIYVYIYEEKKTFPIIPNETCFILFVTQYLLLHELESLLFSQITLTLVTLSVSYCCHGNNQWQLYFLVTPTKQENMAHNLWFRAERGVF